MLVAMNPLAAEACIQPNWPVVRSRIDVFNAFWPGWPGTGASQMWMIRRSPEFMRRVCPFGRFVAVLASCGLGGPVGTPLSEMNAKFVGSTQFVLQLTKFVVHSRSLMCSE